MNVLAVRSTECGINGTPGLDAMTGGRNSRREKELNGIIEGASRKE
ncbi:MAG: hypothetical protein NUV49_02820 [Patescibacteria group bacterium]|nr:hypothetical protein [Patescibacteria group bacterium]